MINKDGGDNFSILWGDTTVMRGDIELMGVPPVPPTRENPGKVFSIVITFQIWACPVMYVCKLSEGFYQQILY